MRLCTSLLPISLVLLLLFVGLARPQPIVDEAVKSRIGPLLEWARRGGVFVHEQIRIGLIAGKGLGVSASVSLKAGTEIMRIPTTLLLSQKAATDELTAATFNLHETMLRVLSYLGPTNAAAVLLMNERAHKDSFWKPYLDSLPTSFNTPIFYPENILQELKGIDLYDWTHKRKNTIDAHYDFILESVIKAHPELFDANVFTKDLFVWALSIVWSRSFAIYIGDERHPSLVPLADLMNHDIPDNVEGVTVGSGASEYFVLRLKNDVEKGTEFTVKYTAQPSTDRILLDYGYVINDNTHDSILITLKGVEAQSEKAETALKIFRLPREFTFPIGNQASIPPEIMASLRVHAMADEDFTKRMGGQWNPYDMLSESTETRSLRWVGSHLYSLLKQFNTTIKQDQELIRHIPLHIPTEHEQFYQLAIEFRYRHRRFINTLVHQISDEIEQLRHGKKDQKLFERRKRLSPQNRGEL